jgi:hypothetical protein
MTEAHLILAVANYQTVSITEKPAYQRQTDLRLTIKNKIEKGDRRRNPDANRAERLIRAE